MNTVNGNHKMELMYFSCETKTCRKTSKNRTGSLRRALFECTASTSISTRTTTECSAKKSYQGKYVFPSCKTLNNQSNILHATCMFRYGTGTLTPVFLDRVFQECLTYDGEMVCLKESNRHLSLFCFKF